MKVFLGDNSIYLANFTQAKVPTAYLLDYTNINNIKEDDTVYTSIADLGGIVQLAEVLRKADIIEYVDSDFSDDKKYKEWTLEYVRTFALDKSKRVINAPSNQSIKLPFDLIDKRQGEAKQLWFAGCSVTVGEGVKDHERYCNLLSKKLKLPFSLLARGGSSIKWTADQILRSDVRENDIVVWGMTSINRFPFVTDEGILIHVNPASYLDYQKRYKRNFFDIFDSSHLQYEGIISIYQVVNFCRKIKAKLIVAGLLLDTESAESVVGLPEYLHCHNFRGRDYENFFIDVGSDDRHPGPKQHQEYADSILEKLKQG
jgi:hypothetical protein